MITEIHPRAARGQFSLGNDTEKLPELSEVDRESLGESPQPSTSREAIKRPLPRDFDGINGNLSEAEWDYEAMGLSYDELMEYFDNLKESTAWTQRWGVDCQCKNAQQPYTLP